MSLFENYRIIKELNITTLIFTLCLLRGNLPNEAKSQVYKLQCRLHAARYGVLHLRRLQKRLRGLVNPGLIFM